MAGVRLVFCAGAVSQILGPPIADGTAQETSQVLLGRMPRARGQVLPPATAKAFPGRERRENRIPLVLSLRNRPTQAKLRASLVPLWSNVEFFPVGAKVQRHHL